MIGTRWLAHRQTIVNILVRLVYLALTFGRGNQTFGEEYTDILPYHAGERRIASRKVGPGCGFPSLLHSMN